MIQIQTHEIEGLLLLKPDIFPDDRGIFLETFNNMKINSLGKEAKIIKETNFVQDNLATNVRKNVIRGMHFQKTKLQAKLVSCLMGSILDVVVDFRRESPTFGKSFSFLLNDKEFNQLFIPRGCAHGYKTIEDFCIVSYKADNYYDQEDYTGVIWNDPELNINWELSDSDEITISEQDANWGTFKDFSNSDIVF